MTDPSASNTATDAKFSLAMSSMLHTCANAKTPVSKYTGSGGATKGKTYDPKRHVNNNKKTNALSNTGEYTYTQSGGRDVTITKTGNNKTKTA